MIQFTTCSNTAGPNPGKHFALTSDGQLAKETVGGRNRLHMKTVTANNQQHLADLISAMGPEHHMMCAVTAEPECMGLSAHSAKPLFASGIDVDEATGLPITGLTKSFLKFPTGPALMVIDCDGMSTDEAWQQIQTVAPGLAGAGCVLTSSSSSRIFDADGNVLRGDKGGHIYIGVANGTDIPRTLNALHQLLWIGGYGRGLLSKAGGFLERSAVDRALANVTQPVFVLATLSDDLHQDKQIHVVDGVWPVDTRTAVPDLSREQLGQYAQAVAAAREALIPEQTECRRAYIEQRAAELGGGESAYAMVAASLSGGDLPPDFPIVMTSGELVTCRKIMAEPGKYHRMSCRDPIEPDYGSAAVAMIFTDGNGARIHSHAHGGRTFHLTDGAPAPVDLVEFLADMEEAGLAEVQALRGDKELVPWLQAIPASLRGSAPVPLIGGDTAPASEIAKQLAVAHVTSGSLPDLIGADVAPHAALGLAYRIEGRGVVRVELGVDGFVEVLKAWKEVDYDGALLGWPDLAAQTMNHELTPNIVKAAANELRVPLGDARKLLASALHEQCQALGQLRTKAQPQIPVFKVPDDPDEEALARAMGVAPAAVCEAADQHGIEFHNATRIRRAADGSLMITDRTNAKGHPLPDMTAVHNGHLKIEGMIRTGAGDNWGRLVSWKDSDDQAHTLVLKVSDLEGDAIEVRKELASKGLIIDTNGQAAAALVHVLKLWPAPGRVRSVTKLGWSGSSFVTPGQCFGAESAERVVYAPENSGVSEADFAHAGSVSEWIERVAVPSLSSTRIAVAISAAFAPPLLKLLNQEGGAVHLHGASSAGKSTALICAASVFGPPSLRVKGWRSTSNGLEGVAAGHNDLPLVLDEMGTVTASEVGQISYMLTNGQGKIRATKTGGSRAPYTWRTLVLSSGEVTMRTVMGRAKVTVDAGMEVRMLSVPVDGLAHGVFETLPLGCPDGATASQMLKTGAAECHGTVGASWLSWLTTHTDAAGAGRDLVAQITQQLHEAHPGLAAQAGRGMGRFAIIAAGGELATRAGLTGWAEGDATRAVAACVGAWLDGMDGGGTDQLEDVRGVDLVRSFLQTQAARFLNREDAEKSEPTKVRVHNCAGYLDKNDFKHDFLIFPSVFSGEICEGHDPKRIAAALKARGFLDVGADGKHSKPVTVGGVKARFYVISGTIMEEANN